MSFLGGSSSQACGTGKVTREFVVVCPLVANDQYGIFVDDLLSAQILALLVGRSLGPVDNGIGDHPVRRWPPQGSIVSRASRYVILGEPVQQSSRLRSVGDGSNKRIGILPLGQEFIATLLQIESRRDHIEFGMKLHPPSSANTKRLMRIAITRRQPSRTRGQS